jgi:hypothetical protein
VLLADGSRRRCKPAELSPTSQHVLHSAAQLMGWPGSTHRTSKCCATLMPPLLLPPPLSSTLLLVLLPLLLLLLLLRTHVTSSTPLLLTSSTPGGRALVPANGCSTRVVGCTFLRARAAVAQGGSVSGMHAVAP